MPRKPSTPKATPKKAPEAPAQCKICGQEIKPRAGKVQCPQCETVYHKTCWNRSPYCVTASCMQQAVAVKTTPEDAAPAVEAEPAPTPKVAEPESTIAAVAHLAEPVAEAILTMEVPPPPLQDEKPIESEDVPRRSDLYELPASELDGDRRLERLTRTSLPIRVKSGEFSEQSIAIESASGRVVLEWTLVHFVCLGIIEEEYGESPAARSGLRNMVRKLFFGESTQENVKRKVRDTYLLDVYFQNQEAPYRFDAGVVNYRSFLGKISYVSAQNFTRLAAKIVHHSSNSYLDTSLASFLSVHRDRVRRYATVYDYELESGLARARLEGQVARRDFELRASLLEPEQAFSRQDESGALD